MLHRASYLPLFVHDNKVNIEIWLFGTPIQHINKDLINSPHFNTCYAIYSSKDWMQRMDPQGLRTFPCNFQNLWSNRMFEAEDRCIQAHLTVNNKPIAHSYYRYIFKHLTKIQQLVKAQAVHALKHSSPDQLDHIRKKNSMLFLLIHILIVSFSAHSCAYYQVQDSSKLYQAYVTDIIYPKTIEEIQQIVIQAHQEDKKISIAGQRYSQGGQSHAHNTINIDLKYFNKLVQLNKKEKTVKVQAGMTWEQLQNILQPYGLSIKVMQSSNVFSIGGSASVNVHGRDLRYGPMIETIVSCTIVNCHGQIQRLSRYENAELFSLVVGGYGLFGIIAEVELSLTDNSMCYKKQTPLRYNHYIQHFQRHILKNLHINLHYARLTTIPGKAFLRDIISVSYLTDRTKSKNATNPLREETNIAYNQKIFNFYRKHYGTLTSWLKAQLELHSNAPWETGEHTCRNQLMRPYIHCLKNNNCDSTDLLQEYFIPPTSFTKFVDQLRLWSEFYNIKLLNVTIRWVPKNHESFLTYATQDSFAFVLFFNTHLDEKSLKTIKSYTNHLINACQQCNGTFYLPYQQFASLEQVYNCYPMMKDFIAKKMKYDPSSLFINNWYKDYILQAPL